MPIDFTKEVLQKKLSLVICQYSKFEFKFRVFVLMPQFFEKLELLPWQRLNDKNVVKWCEFCDKEEKMQLIEFRGKNSRFDLTLGISNAISFEQWMNKLWWKTKTWGYTHKRNLKLFRPSSEILVHLKFRQHYKKCGAFCFKEGVNSYMLSLVSNYYRIIHDYEIL